MIYSGRMKMIQPCCSPVLAEPIASGAAEELAAAFKVLADPTRLRILSLVANADNGELCACDLPALTGKAQPTVSHHLKLLTAAGLLVRKQRGKWAWFRVQPDRLSVLREALAVRST